MLFQVFREYISISFLNLIKLNDIMYNRLKTSNVSVENSIFPLSKGENKSMRVYRDPNKKIKKFINEFLLFTK